MWQNIILVLPVILPVLAGLAAWKIENRTARNALVGAAEELRRRGVTILDTEMVTSTTALFGAREVPRAQFLQWLRA